MKIESIADPKDVEVETRLRTEIVQCAGLIDNTEDDTGVIFPIPNGIGIQRIVSTYDTNDTTKIKVRCAACKHKQAHNRGFRVELTTGQHARVGHDCGEVFFGTGAWEYAKADLNRRQDNAQYVARIKPALDALTLVLPLVDEWHQLTKRLAQWTSNFRSSLPELYGRLEQQSRNFEGCLEYQRWKKSKFVDKNGQEKSKSSFETVVISRIPYPDMFLGQTPNNGINGAKKDLMKAVALLSNKTDTNSLARAFKHIRDARTHLNDAADAHQGIEKNRNIIWLHDLCIWANRDDQLSGEYRFSTNSLIYSEGVQERMIEFPAQSTYPPLQLQQIFDHWPN